MTAERTGTLHEPPFVIAREFDASPELMWKTWTEAARLKQWWGPKGFAVHTCKVELRPGGMFHYGMKAPDGSNVWGRFIYREIDAPRRLVFVVSFSDPAGAMTRHPGNARWPMQMLSTVTFEGMGVKTRVTVQWEPLEATGEERGAFYDGRASMQQGWTGTFEQLADYLSQAV